MMNRIKATAVLTATVLTATGLILTLSPPALAKTPAVTKAPLLQRVMKRMLPKRFRSKPHPQQVQNLIAQAKKVRPSFLETVGASETSNRFDKNLLAQALKIQDVPVHSALKLGKLTIMPKGKKNLAKSYVEKYEKTLSAKEFVRIAKISPWVKTVSSILGDAAKSQLKRWTVEDLNTLRKGTPFTNTRLMIKDLMNDKMGE